jgi:glucose-6-phosphate dehydrogenase assembly protein OpcA
VASTWDPPERRRRLAHLSALEVGHGPDCAAEALLLAGWIAARAGLDPEAVSLQSATEGIESVAFTAGNEKIHVEPPPAGMEGAEAFARALVASRAFRSGYTDALSVARTLRGRL